MTKLVFCGMCLALCCHSAQSQSHVPEPVVNLGDTSFLDAMGGPGLLVEEIGDGTHSVKVADGSGHTVSATPAINTISGMTHVAWLSNHRILKAWYGVEVVAVAADVNAGIQGSARGWADLTVSPLILQWAERNIHKIRIDQRIVFDFELPTGEYRRDSNVNIGSNTYTVHPYYAVTLLSRKHFETSWRIHYLWNGRNDAPPLATGARSTQAGQAVHFNATVGYALPHGLWVGANGYFLKQVTAPLIEGVALRNSPEQVGAIGPGVAWNLGRFLLYANAYHELGSENRAEGNKIVARFQWIVGK